jgi:hypothetical protein
MSSIQPPLGKVLPLSAVFLASLVASASTQAVARSSKPHPVPCEFVAKLHWPGTTIDTTESIDGGSFTPPGATTPLTGLPPFCRVAGSIKPTSDSDIRFEVWMPKSGWNEKFLSAGEGGYAGAINYGGIAAALRRGYAGGSTDTGHVGGTADFAPGHPEKVIDFGWRGKHLQAVRSKDIIRTFYRHPVKHSYFSSCSNGGRQAMMEIQRFPEDYDGVLVGAPAHDWTHLFAGFVWNEQALWNTPGAHVSAAKLAAVQAATLATCDALDGVIDGVAEDPRQCTFDPASLACPTGTDSDTCLTPPQVSAVRKIMQGPSRDSHGHHLASYGSSRHFARRQIFPGYFTSAAGAAASWPAWITGPAVPGASIQAFFGNAFFGRVIEEIPAPGVWDFSTFDFGDDMKAADRKAEDTFNATDPDLSSFRRRNHRGKIIIWHGWEDPAISALSAIDYYQQVLRENRDADRFVRLFLAPGMLHCGGGPGPNSFGQSLPQATPLSNAPQHDILSALERWVEDGVPPERIVAAKYVNDQPAQGVQRTRPLCAYPKVAVYRGTGSTDDAANFDCRQPRGWSWPR